jgi:diguanylate cyclase (GGDEF)-like protein
MTRATFQLPPGSVSELRRLHAAPERIARGLSEGTVARALDLARLLGAESAALHLVGSSEPFGAPGLTSESEGARSISLQVPLLPTGEGSSRAFGTLTSSSALEDPESLGCHVATLLVTAALSRAAEEDPLTGLLTRAAFERALATVTERIGAERIAVLMLDVDDLGTLNAARGYRGGDDLLRTLGAAASSEAAEGLACRYGGDELALVLPGGEEGQIRALAERLRAVVESCKAGSAKPSLCAGIARGPEDGETAEELIYRADQALARAKSQGRGQSVRWEPYLQRQRRRDRLAGILTGDPARDYRNVQALLESVQAVSRLGPLPETLREIVGRAVEIAGADRGLLLLKEGEEWSVRVALLASGEPTSGEAFAASVADAALSEGGPISRIAEGVEEISMSAQALGLKAVLCAPLLGEDVPTGVLYVDAAATPGRFDAPTVAFFGALGGEVATALRNASLYERLVARTEQLEADVNEREQTLVRLREGWARLRGGATPGGYAGIVGQSQVMREVFAQLESLEGTSVSVLIEGESGTGKELVARALHARSARHEEPFVAINCAAIPASLFESELFGHVKGAFTGAEAERKGLLEAADGGTLFLDEVGELPPEAQAKLLRVLQEKEVRRVGETKARQVDLRVISATNRCLRTASDEGVFREDLYYRLAVFRIPLPPLRERAADLPLLIEHLLEEQRARGVEVEAPTPAALEALAGRRWRGNVRELRNALERAAALAMGGSIEPEHFEAEASGPQPEAGFGELLALPFHEAKAAFGLHYVKALVEQEGSIPAAAKAAGVSRQTFYRLLNRAEG